MKKLIFFLICSLFTTYVYSAENVSTVGSGQTYATLAAWQTAKAGDITAGNDEVAEVHGTLTAGLAFSGWTCDADSRAIIRGYDANSKIVMAADGQMFTLSGSSQKLILIVEKMWLEPKGTTTDSSVFYADGSEVGSKTTVRQCTLDGSDSTHTWGIFGVAGNTEWDIYNNFFYGFAYDGLGAIYIYYTSETNIYNNTFIHNTIDVRVSADAGASSVMIKNNAALKAGLVSGYECFYGMANVGVSTASCYNLSSDASADDDRLSNSGHYFVSKTTTSCNITAWQSDPSIVSGSGDLYNAGTDLFTDPHSRINVTTDLEGDTLTVRNDIGADEYVSASPPASAPIGFPVIIINQ